MTQPTWEWPSHTVLIKGRKRPRNWNRSNQLLFNNSNIDRKMTINTSSVITDKNSNGK